MVDLLSKGEVLGRINESEKVLAPGHKAQRDDMDFLYSAEEDWKQRMRFYLDRDGFPPNFPLKTPPMAKFAVDAYLANVQTGNVPEVNVALPRRKSDTKIEAEERSKGGFSGLLWQSANMKGENPYRAMAAHVIALGNSALAHPPDETLWEDPPLGWEKRGNRAKPGGTAEEREKVALWEMRRYQGLPWRVEAVHPLNLMFDPWHDPVQWVGEKKQVSRSAVQAMFGKEMAARVGAGSTKTMLTCYCDDQQYGYFLNGHPLLDSEDGAVDGIAPNPTGAMWYEMAWSGMGSMDDAGNWQHRMKGIIRDNRPAFAMYIIQLNVNEALRMINAFPTIYLTPNPARSLAEMESDEADAELTRFRVGAAKMLAMKYWIPQRLVLPDVTQALMNSMEEAKNLIGIGAGPDVLRGEWRSEPASSLLTRLEQARAPIMAAKASCEQAVAMMLYKMGYQVKQRYRTSIYRWHTLGGQRQLGELRPEDFDPAMQITVDFTPPTMQERRAIQESLIERQNAGAITKRRVIALNDSPVIDADEEYAEILADRVMETDPRVLKIVSDLVLGPEQPAAPEPVMPDAGAASPVEGGAIANPEMLTEPFVEASTSPNSEFGSLQLAGVA